MPNRGFHRRTLRYLRMDLGNIVVRYNTRLCRATFDGDDYMRIRNIPHWRPRGCKFLNDRGQLAAVLSLHDRGINRNYRLRKVMLVYERMPEESPVVIQDESQTETSEGGDNEQFRGQGQLRFEERQDPDEILNMSPGPMRRHPPNPETVLNPDFRLIDPSSD